MLARLMSNFFLLLPKPTKQNKIDLFHQNLSIFNWICAKNYKITNNKPLSEKVKYIECKNLDFPSKVLEYVSHILLAQT